MNEQAATDGASVERPAQPSTSFRIAAWHWVVLALIVALAAALRLHRIDATSIWCDELLSLHMSGGWGYACLTLPREVLIASPPNMVAISDRPWWTIWTSLDLDVHPPLYYLALRGWRAWAGDSLFAVRALSALFGTLAVFTSFLAGREVVGTAGALWVGLLTAVAADTIYYGQEARMYSLSLVWITLALFQLLNAERRGFTIARGVWLALWCLLSMLTLYFAAIPMVALAIYAAIRLRGRALARAIGSFATAAIAYATIWLPFLLRQDVFSPEAGWLQADATGHVGRTLARVAELPLAHFGPVLQRSAIFAYVFAALYVLPLLVAKRRPAVLLPWLVFVLAAAVPMIEDLARSTAMLEWSRYTLTMVPAGAMIFVATGWKLRSPMRHLIPAALFIYSVVSIPAAFGLQRYDFRANARVAERAVMERSARPVFVTTRNTGFSGVLLLSAQFHWKSPPHDVILAESVDAIQELPRDVLGDKIVLIAGDATADFSKLPSFELDGPQGWSLGVGSVTTMKRRTVTTQPGEYR